MKFSRVFLSLSVLAFMAAPAHADGGTLLISGTSQLDTETVTASYELFDGVLVPGSVDVSVVGPGNISFAGAVPIMSGRCNSDLNLGNGAEFLQITFYEDSNCIDGGAIQPGDLGLFYMKCPKGVCETGVLDTFGHGFALVTDPPNVPTPEPSFLGMVAVGLFGLAALKLKLA